MFQFLFRVKSKSLWLGALCALYFLTSVSVSAQSGSAIVRTEPSTLEVGQGQVETLNIVIDNAQDLYGIDVRAKFDPSIMEIVNADPTKDGVTMIPGPLIKPDFLVRNTADNQKGTLQYVITQVNPTPPVNGSGTVLSIWVRGKALGKRATFTIDFVEIADRRGKKLLVRPQNGTVSIVSPKPPTLTPTSNAIVALAPTLTPAAKQTEVAEASQTTGFSDTRRANNNLFFDGLLFLIATAGCLGAVIVSVFAAFIVLRRPPRTARPSNR